MLNIVFMASGAGGDFSAMEKAKSKQFLDYNTSMLIATDKSSKCFYDAQQKGYHVEYIDAKSISRIALNSKISSLLDTLTWDLCILAGYKYIISPEIVSKYAGRIINSHPSILPAHPGLFKKEKLILSDNKLLGATVHFIDPGIDTGIIINQAAFPNYGISEIDLILRKYRFIQDVLMISAISQLNKGRVDKKINVHGDMLFAPAVDYDVVSYFRNEHQILDL